jgi:hypothetical protein
MTAVCWLVIGGACYLFLIPGMYCLTLSVNRILEAKDDKRGDWFSAIGWPGLLILLLCMASLWCVFCFICAPFKFVTSGPDGLRRWFDE